VSFDWNQARSFLVTAEEGSFSAAARALGLTQPTLGRQVSELEAELGVTLFERAGRSVTLTQSGLELVEHVRAMGDAAARFSLAASGQSQAIEGVVRLSISEFIAVHWLPPVLKRLRAEAPGIEIDVVVSDSASDLTRREADIAIRHFRPEQPDLIAKLVQETTAHLYASVEFLERRGRPATPADLARYDFVAYVDPDRMAQGLNPLGIPVTRENFKVSCTSVPACVEFVKQGLGITIMTKEMAALWPELECVLPEIPAYPGATWLVTHRELHTSRRIRLVYDLLADAFAQGRAPF